MSQDDETPAAFEQPGSAEGATEEFPTLAGNVPAVSDADPDLDPDLEPLEDDEWAVRGPARGIRLAVPLAGLLAVLLVAAGFWGGAALEKSHGGGSSGGAASAASFAARFRGLRAGAAGGGAGGAAAGGAGGFAGFGGAAAAGTSGTISIVDGNTLYVLSSTGSLVKVNLTSATTITRNATATSTDLRPGDTVTIQGASSANGSTVTASSIAATGPGVSAAGFGGGGRFAGGGSGASTTTTSNGAGG
jgi:hypothetical protein